MAAKTKITIATIVGLFKQSEEQLNLKFDFISKQVVDTTNKSWKLIGDFNKSHTGRNNGKVLISPLALATIRMRIEELDDWSTTDKVVKDAILIFYEDEMKSHNYPASGVPWWLVSTGGESS